MTLEVRVSHWMLSISVTFAEESPGGEGLTHGVFPTGISLTQILLLGVGDQNDVSDEDKERLAVHGEPYCVTESPLPAGEEWQTTQ